MITPTCDCPALKERLTSLLKANGELKKEIESLRASLNEQRKSSLTATNRLLTTNQKLMIENKTFAHLISKMRELRERELSDSSGTDSNGEEQDSQADVNKSSPSVGEASGMGAANRDDNDDKENETDLLELPDDDNGIGKQDDSLWHRQASWKCAQCENVIRGSRYHRLKHIAVHKKFHLKCPFDGCDSVHSLQGLHYKHIPNVHKVKCSSLTKSMKAHLRKDRAKCLENSAQFERKFFPEKNVADMIKLTNEICKKCSTTVISRNGQGDHVAAHLGLKIQCPFVGCKKQCASGALCHHIQITHKKKMDELDERVKERLKKARKVYMQAAKEAKNDYF